MQGPDPMSKHPMEGFPQVCFIKNTVTNPNIIIGDYTYYDDPEDSENFERNVLYHFPFIGDRLVIGKFCAIAKGVQFIMNGANHKLSSFSTFPFYIFGNGWEKATPKPEYLPYKGDTIVGGNPAKVIKSRFSDEIVIELEKLAWWDWSVEKITKNLAAIMSNDIKMLQAIN
ncbi:chloramphenicol acetyltransferase [Enterobacteriaceae bacterium H16N7]|nr:chloramphenicol acetyltransferase [Dryocola clanedunensis]